MAFPPEQASYLRASFSVSRKKGKIFLIVHLFQLNVSRFASAPHAAARRMSYDSLLAHTGVVSHQQ